MGGICLVVDEVLVELDAEADVAHVEFVDAGLVVEFDPCGIHVVIEVAFVAARKVVFETCCVGAEVGREVALVAVLIVVFDICWVDAEVGKEVTLVACLVVAVVDAVVIREVIVVGAGVVVVTAAKLS